MSGYDPDAILADPNAHPVYKLYAEINVAYYFGDTTASREQWSAVVMNDEPAMVQIAPGVVAM